MGYETFILFIDTMAIVFLMALAFLLCFANRFKGDSTYAALIIFTITLPDYIYNVCDFFGWQLLALVMAPIAYSANLTLMPFLLLLAHRAFNPRFRFRYTVLLHFLPAIAFAGLVAYQISKMSITEIQSFSVELAPGFRTLLTGVNFLILLMQLIAYFYLIFTYLRKVKHYIFSNFSQPELSGKIWIPRFITFMGILVLTAMVASHFNPLDGFRLFYFANVVAMAYLLFQELEHANRFRRHSISATIEVPVVTEGEVEAFDEEFKEAESKKDEATLMKQYAQMVMEYLQTSEAYVHSDLSMAEVSRVTGIASRNISKAINTVLGKTFFDLVNGFRIEKSKKLLRQKKQLGLTLETIAEQCGFNSQSTFCRVFKKTEGVSTSEWLRLMH